jgi:hypothetical protein
LILHDYRNEPRNTRKLAIYECRENDGKTLASRLSGARMTRPRSFDEITNSVEYRMTRASLIRTFLRKKPTVVENRAVNAAALLACRAEIAGADPNVSGDELAKIAAAARRAYDVVAKMTAARRRTSTRMLSAGELRP